MHFGAEAWMGATQTREIIEQMVSAGLKGLCQTCVHDEICVYHRNAKKTIIQCELFEDYQVREMGPPALQGLCKTCDHAPYCRLTEKRSGVWHCNEFR